MKLRKLFKKNKKIKTVVYRTKKKILFKKPLRVKEVFLVSANRTEHSASLRKQKNNGLIRNAKN